MKVLFVIPNLEFGGAARQLTLLAAGLPGEQFQRRVCVLGRAGPWADTLRQAGVDVEVLGWQRAFDPLPVVRLHRLAREFQPDIVHAWQLPALRFLALAWARARARLVVSHPFRPGTRRLRLGWPDRRLLARANRIVLATGADVQCCRTAGLPESNLVHLAPGVALTKGASTSHAGVCRSLGLPATARLLVGLGPVEPAKGFHDGLWALHMLQSLYDDLHLVLVGRGSDRVRLEHFAHTNRSTERLHLLGPVDDVGPLLEAAELVWVPDRSGASLNAALEAMTAGRAVVGSRSPALAEVVTDGETGLLVPPGDRAALARQTRRLLDDEPLRQRLGAAGRERAATHFSTGALAQRWAQLYGNLR